MTDWTTLSALGLFAPLLCAACLVPWIRSRETREAVVSPRSLLQIERELSNLDFRP